MQSPWKRELWGGGRRLGEGGAHFEVNGGKSVIGKWCIGKIRARLGDIVDNKTKQSSSLNDDPFNTITA